MSIDFKKKDYHYDGDDILYEDAMEEEDEEDENPEYTIDMRKIPTPSNWTISLYEELKEYAETNAIDVFDKLELSTFTEFTSQYKKDVYN